MSKKSKIEIAVTLDDENMPENIEWKAMGHPEHQKFQEAKAMILALFDGEDKETLKIDLWTQKMQIVEMDRFIFQLLNSMADTYVKATNNKELAGAMQQFAKYFGEKTEVIESKE